MEQNKLYELKKNGNNKEYIILLFIVPLTTKFINELPQWLYIISLCIAAIVAIRYLIIPNWESIKFIFFSTISKYKWWEQNEKLRIFHLKFISSIIYIAGFVLSLVIINVLLYKSLTNNMIWSFYCFYLLCIGIIDLKNSHDRISLRSTIKNAIIYFIYVVIFYIIFSVLFTKIPTIIYRVFFILFCFYFLFNGIFTIKKYNNTRLRMFLKNILWYIYILILLFNYTYSLNIFSFPINSISKLFTGNSVFGEWVEYERGFLGLYKTNGYRIYKSPNGYIAEGSFINNILNGDGKITYVNGRIVEGKFKNYMLNGEGKIIYASGCISEGFFINNKLNGRGKKTHVTKNGYYIEEGYFFDNKLNGEGKIKYVYNDSIVIEEGYFINNKLNGRGIKNYSNGHIEEGIFIDGKLNKGIINYPDGNLFEGTYINGYANGEGKLTYANGRINKGVFVDGELINGIMSYPDGRIEEGSFIDGLLSEGKRTYADGSIYEGSFIYGEIMDGKAKIIYPNEDVRIVVFVLGNIHEIPINIHHRH